MDKQRTPDSAGKQAGRKPYHGPVLSRFGDLASLTATVGSMGGSDGPGPPGMNKSQ